jgi:hypothetical protein
MIVEVLTIFFSIFSSFLKKGVEHLNIARRAKISNIFNDKVWFQRDCNSSRI